MKYYYYAKNNQQLGPFTFEEIKSKQLAKSTLVWTDGMPDWDSADTINELKEFLLSEPPPLPSKRILNQKKAIATKYDLTYKREFSATVIGIFLLGLFIVLPLLIKSSYRNPMTFIFLFSLVIRIISPIWVVRIASRQNRKTTSWGWFAFFLPSIALVIIGVLKRLSLNIELEDSIPIDIRVSILMSKAKKFYANKRNPECIEILNKVIELDNQNNEAIKYRAYTYLRTKTYDKAKRDFEKLVERKVFLSISNYYLGNLEIKYHNRAKAVELWLVAKENGSENAQLKLDQYHTFTGKYVFNNTFFSEQTSMKKKLLNPIVHRNHFFYNYNYKGGIQLIDKDLNFDKLKTKFMFFDNGFSLKLILKFMNYYNIAIAFYEIEDITYDNNNTFKIYLIDKNVLLFTFNKIHDNIIGLKYFCKRHKKATGINTTALKNLEDLDK